MGRGLPEPTQPVFWPLPCTTPVYTRLFREDCGWISLPLGAPEAAPPSRDGEREAQGGVGTGQTLAMSVAADICMSGCCTSRAPTVCWAPF
jgi:hypothetical protein